MKEQEEEGEEDRDEDLEYRNFNLEYTFLHCFCITECGLFIGMIYSRRPLERSKYDFR